MKNDTAEKITLIEIEHMKWKHTEFDYTQSFNLSKNCRHIILERAKKLTSWPQ
jgi:hypothetical protein